MPEEVKTKLAGVSESSSEGVGLKSGKFVFSNGDVYEGDDWENHVSKAEKQTSK